MKTYRWYEWVVLVSLIALVAFGFGLVVQWIIEKHAAELERVERLERIAEEHEAEPEGLPPRSAEEKYTLYMVVTGRGRCYDGLAHAEHHMMGEMDPWKTRLTTVEGARFDIDGTSVIGVYHNMSQWHFLNATLYDGDHGECVTPPERPKAPSRNYSHH